MIRLENVEFKREQRHILQDLNWHVRPSENWVILGRNGSGKSTVLEMINGYLFPSSGKIQVLDHVYGACDVREVRKKIGYISQALLEKMTLRDPVWEVVATGAFGFLRFYEVIDQELHERAVEMLRQLKLEHVQDQPLGTLSQGERKKAMLARVMMMNPALLILDEPCAGLDLYEREHFLHSLQDLHSKNMQILYVTHHIEEIVPIFTHVALMNSGKLIAADEKKHVLTDSILQEAYQIQVHVEWENERPWIKMK